MARTKEFDRTTALDKAMRLFWKQGYEATSMQDLCDVMGINRGSLYDTFGNKRFLFLDAIQRYLEIHPIEFDSDSDSFSAVATIEKIFMDMVDEGVTDTSRSGCFMANTIVELAPHDMEIATLCINSRNAYEDLFSHLLTYAEEHDEIPSGKNLIAISRFLVNTVYGLRLTAKTTNDRDILEDIVRSALLILH